MSTVCLFRKDKKVVKPSFTFLAKKRAPYSYVKHAEAPPVGLYNKKFSYIDRGSSVTHIDARLGDSVDKR
jgi:hypothetical protein